MGEKIDIGGKIEQARSDERIGSISADPEDTIPGDLYDKQLEIAAITLSPYYVALRDMESKRQERNKILTRAGDSSFKNVYGAEFIVSEGVFLIAREDIPYEQFLFNELLQVPESSGSGIKRAGEKILFDRFHLRSTMHGDTPGVEMEITEYPNSPLAEPSAPGGILPVSRFTLINKYQIDPERHSEIGFLVCDNPDIEVKPYPSLF